MKYDGAISVCRGGDYENCSAGYSRTDNCVIAYPIAYAQKAITDPGKQEFEVNCGVCHGMDAKGNGVLGASLKMVPPDLTLLAKNNGGVFPADRISSVIDGRAQVATHGTREMPIWGSRYAVDVGEHYADAEAFVRGRVLLLVDYLNRVQQK